MLEYPRIILGLFLALYTRSSVPYGLHQPFKTDQQKWEANSNFESLMQYYRLGAIFDNEYNNDADEAEAGGYSSENKNQVLELETKLQITEDRMYASSWVLEVIVDPRLIKSRIGKQETGNSAQEINIDETPRMPANFTAVDDTLALYDSTETVTTNVLNPLEINQGQKATNTFVELAETPIKIETNSYYHPRLDDLPHQGGYTLGHTAVRLQTHGSLSPRRIIHLIAPTDVYADDDKRTYQLKTRVYPFQTKSQVKLRDQSDWLHEWVQVSGGAVKVLRIMGDGDCLFAAIRHQLTTVLKLENPPSVNELRRQASVFLKEAKSDDLVAETIRATAEEDPALQKDRTNDTLVDKFIDLLATTKSFGGAESIYALSQLYQVSIHVYNERAQDFVVSEFPQRIRICYRLSRGNQRKRLHYDSVVSVEMKTARTPKVAKTSTLPSYMKNIIKYRDYINKFCPAWRLLLN